MKRTVIAAIMLLGTLQLILAAQEGDSEEAAPTTFEEAMQAAHTEYTANLEAALELAIAEGELDEAVHVRRMIAMEKLRADLIGTTWTRNRPNRPATIQFHSARRATTNNQAEGVWDVIEDRVVLLKFSDAVLMYKFNEDTTSYSVRAYGPIKTEFTTGRRVGSTN